MAATVVSRVVSGAFLAQAGSGAAGTYCFSSGTNADVSPILRTVQHRQWHSRHQNGVPFLTGGSFETSQLSYPHSRHCPRRAGIKWVACLAPKTDVWEELNSSLLSLHRSPGQEGLLFGKGSQNSWDSGGVGAPVVRRYQSDDEDRWFMWYQGWRAAGQVAAAVQEGAPGSVNTVPAQPLPRVGLALSSNGLLWSRGTGLVETDERGEGGAGLVLDCSSNWWTFDTCHVSVSDVLVMDSKKVRAQGGVYWMYYSGGDAEELPSPEALLGAQEGAAGVVQGQRMRPGLAMSNDGRNWARIEGEHHSGALFDVGEEGAWDARQIVHPQVVYHEAGDLRMYYHTQNSTSGLYTAGVARSRDGLKWQKGGPILTGGEPGSFDEKGVASRHVVQDPAGKGYLMLYEGVAADGKRSLGVATSQDGLMTWSRRSKHPVFGPSQVEGAWDCLGVSCPSLVDVGQGRWRLYYVGIGEGGQTGIGMAESESPDLRTFRRWQLSVSIP